jgi:hypothetical protein
MNDLLPELDVVQLITLIAASIAAITSVLTAFLAILSERGSKRREWARTELSKTYFEIIRAAHLAEEILSTWEGEEASAAEAEPAEVPHYAWDEKGQAHLEGGHRRITFALAEVEMVAPKYVVKAAQELHSQVWLAESYHRLAHTEEILEIGPVENRRLRVAKAIRDFIDAVRRDLGV